MGRGGHLGRGAFRPSSPASAAVAQGADTFRRAAEAYGLQDFLDAITIEGDAVHIDGKRARAANRGGQVHHFLEGHRQLVGRLIAMEPYDGVSANLGCDYAASRAPAISAQSSKVWERAVR